jgi:hypothetical protein
VVPTTITISKIRNPKNDVKAVKNVVQDYDLQKYNFFVENHWFSSMIDREIELHMLSTFFFPFSSSNFFFPFRQFFFFYILTMSCLYHVSGRNLFQCQLAQVLAQEDGAPASQ